MQRASRRDALRLIGVGAAAIGATAVPTAAEGETVTWTRTLSGGDMRLAGVAAAEAGGYVVAGSRDGDGYTAAFGPGGSRRWSVEAPGRGRVQLSAIAARGGQYACVGSHEDDIQRDGFLAIVGDGTVVQDHTFGEQQWDDTLHGVTATDDGFLLVGETLDPDDRTARGWAIRTGVAGLETWSQSYESGSKSVFHDAADLGDGFAFAGHSGSEAWVVETDESGEIRRSQTYSGANGALRCTSILPAGSGYYLAGYTGTGSDMRGWIMLVDDAQQQVWRRTYGDETAGRIDDMAAAGGPPFLAGSYGGTGLALRASRTGAAWQQTVADVNGFTGVAAGSDGAVFVGTRSVAGDSEGHVVKGETSEPRTSAVQTESETEAEIPDAGDETTATPIDDAGSTTAPTDDPNGGGGGGAPAVAGETEESPFGVPGFGIPAALAGAGAAGWAALRRGDDEN